MLWQSLHGPYCGAPEDPLFRYMTFHQKKRNQRGIVSLLRKRNSSPRISFTRCSRTDDAVDSEGFSNLYPVCFAVEIILPWSVQFESSPPLRASFCFRLFFLPFLGEGGAAEFYRYTSTRYSSPKVVSSAVSKENHFLSIIFSGIPPVNIGIPPSISQFKWHLRPRTFSSPPPI